MGSGDVRFTTDSILEEANRCQHCRDRASWDILYSVYQRHDAAHAQIVELGKSLRDATTTLGQIQLELTKCKVDLAVGWDKPGEEHPVRLGMATPALHHAAEAAKQGSYSTERLEMKIVDASPAIASSPKASTSDAHPSDAPQTSPERARMTKFPFRA